MNASPNGLIGLIARGERLRTISIKIVKVRYKSESKYSLKLKNKAEIADWLEAADLYFKKRFGEYSKEYKKLHSRLRSHWEAEFLVRAPGEYPLEVPRKSDVERNRQSYKFGLTSIIDEYLKLLKQQVRPDGISFDNLAAVTDRVHSIRSLSPSLKNKMLGNVLSQGIVLELWKILRKESVPFKRDMDDIQKLTELLQKKSPSKQTRSFFSSHFKKFALASRVRQQSCHAYEKAPTKSEIGVCKDLLTRLSTSRA